MSDNRAPAKLTRVDKAAILLLSLGETDAAQVLRHLGPKEVQRVGVAMAGMRNVQREQVEQVMGEFVEIVGDQTSLGVGSDAYIRKMLTAALLAVAGFINALYAKTFDDISIVPTFVLTPLTYLGGVFYSIDLLPAF